MFLSGYTCVIVTRFLESVLIERVLLDVIAAALALPGLVHAWASASDCAQLSQDARLAECLFPGSTCSCPPWSEPPRSDPNAQEPSCSLLWFRVLGVDSLLGGLPVLRAYSIVIWVLPSGSNHQGSLCHLKRVATDRVAVVASCVTSPSYPNTHWPRAPLSRSCWSQPLQLLLLLSTPLPLVDKEL